MIHFFFSRLPSRIFMLKALMKPPLRKTSSEMKVEVAGTALPPLLGKPLVTMALHQTSLQSMASSLEQLLRMMGHTPWISIQRWWRPQILSKGKSLRWRNILAKPAGQRSTIRLTWNRTCGFTRESVLTFAMCAMPLLCRALIWNRTSVLILEKDLLYAKNVVQRLPDHLIWQAIKGRTRVKNLTCAAFVNPISRPARTSETTCVSTRARNRTRAICAECPSIRTVRCKPIFSPTLAKGLSSVPNAVALSGPNGIF